jgi:ABC-2 type transport system ATP-binding protein
MEPAIEIKGLKKHFEDIKAVDGITLNVNRNEIFGLVGPDGAGKTTTIRMLCGLVQPDEGNAIILGYDLQKQKKYIKKEIGYLSQKFSLYQDLTVDENIEFFADIHGVKKFDDRRNELLEFTRLAPFRKFLAGMLSGGMKQKLALACTLIHKPQIIFLDEPTTGVDPVSRRDFWKILSDLLQEGITILISTPYLDEAERFDRLVMLNRGKVLVLDSPENIKNSLHKQVAEIVTSDIRGTFTVLKENTPFEIQIFGDRIDAALDDYGKDFKVIEELLKKNRMEIIDIRTKQPSLENVFIHLLKSENNNLKNE